MLIRAFRENQIFTFLFLFLLSIILWIIIGVNQSFEPDYHSLYNYAAFYLLPSLKAIHHKVLLSSGLNIFLVLLSGNYLTRISARHQIMPVRTLLPMLVFFFLSLPYFSVYSGFSFSLLSLLALMYVVDILFRSAEQKTLSFTYFNSALILSLISLINIYLLFYVFFIFFAYSQLRGMYWREIVFVLIGIALPYAILYGIMYLTDVDISDFNKANRIFWQLKFAPSIDKTVLINGFYLLFLFFVASGNALNKYVKMKIITRKFTVVFLGFFILSVLVALFVPVIDRAMIFFLFAPLSFLFAHFFASCRINILNQILFLLFMLGNVAVFAISFLN